MTSTTDEKGVSAHRIGNALPSATLPILEFCGVAVTGDHPIETAKKISEETQVIAAKQTARFNPPPVPSWRVFQHDMHHKRTLDWTLQALATELRQSARCDELLSMASQCLSSNTFHTMAFVLAVVR
jgi:hypothetical protein